MMTTQGKSNTHSRRRSNARKSITCKGLAPNDLDVVCGRGCAAIHRPGNKAFTAIVQSNLETYNKAHSRVEKTMVVAKVLDEVLATGARFLKKSKSNDEHWVEMRREEAHSKVGHAIRDTIRNQGKDVKACPPIPKAITLRRYHSAGAIKKVTAKKSSKKRRSRSLADVMASFKPHVPDITEPSDDVEIIDNLRLSIESVSSNVIADVLKTVKDLDNSDDHFLFDEDEIMEEFDDTPLPARVESASEPVAVEMDISRPAAAEPDAPEPEPLHVPSEEVFDTTPLRVSSALDCADVLKNTDLASMYDALFD